MEQITNFVGVNKYWCSLHQKFHLKPKKKSYYFDGLGIKHVKLTPFDKCKEHAFKLSNSELFNRKFSDSWSKYSIKLHSETLGSLKQ